MFAKKILKVREYLCNNFRIHAIQKSEVLLPFEKGTLIRNLV